MATKKTTKKEKPRVTLKDLIPMDASFKLGKDVIVLRKVTMKDQVWIREKYGVSFDDVFNQTDFTGILKLIYHQLTEKDKDKYCGQEVEERNDDGILETRLVPGYEHLSSFISTPQEGEDMMYALGETLGISRAMISDLEVDELKKKQAS